MFVHLSNEPELGGETGTDDVSPGTSAKSNSLETSQESNEPEEPVSMLMIRLPSPKWWF